MHLLPDDQFDPYVPSSLWAASAVSSSHSLNQPRYQDRSNQHKIWGLHEIKAFRELVENGTQVLISRLAFPAKEDNINLQNSAV